MYRIFDAFIDDTFTAVEFLAILIHRPAEQAGIDGGCNFGSTTRFGAVTNDAGRNRQRVDKRMGYDIQAAAVQIGDTPHLSHPPPPAPSHCHWAPETRQNLPSASLRHYSVLHTPFYPPSRQILSNQSRLHRVHEHLITSTGNHVQ